MSNFNQNLVSVGLGTTSIMVPFAAPYSLDGKISLPQLVTGATAPSQVVCTINQNGSPIYVGNPGAEGFGVKVPTAAARDIFTFVLTSAAVVDQALNAIKMNVDVSTGQ